MARELLAFLEFLIRNLDGAIGRKLRYFYYKRRLGACGRNVVIEPGVFFQNPASIFVGSNVWIDRYTVLVSGPFTPGGRKFAIKKNADYSGKAGELTISDGVHIAPHTLVQGHGGLRIGKNVTIAAGAKVYTLSHHYRNISDDADLKRYSFSTMAPQEDQFLISSPVVIEDDCAVGLNSVVLPGTTIRKGTWVGVLSFLDHGVTESNVVYQSQPAKKK